MASIYRALAEHAKREAYPEAVEAAHADFAALQAGELPRPAYGGAAGTRPVIPCPRSRTGQAGVPGAH
ncbi:hypothetical protein [Streptomyces sp. NPDC056632]|uniref:hypothetical protein n=1 Tax=Streptomyces sp. NPDC056632 TaxID=3345884 RepID=UPI0036986332